MPERSVTEWLFDVQQGVDSDACYKLVERYLHRLTALARKSLKGMRAYEDESDVAHCALKSFLMRAPHGEFNDVRDRDTLWSLLAAITANKAVDLQRRHLSKGRDIRRVQSLESLLSAEPSEEFLSSMIEEGNRLLERLDDESHRRVALLRMEGYSNQEIADQLGLSVKTIEWKFRLIRKQLRSELESSRG